MHHINTNNKTNKSQSQQQKKNTWNTNDECNLASSNPITAYKNNPNPNPNSANINAYIFNNQNKPISEINLREENFSYFTENYTKIISTNKIQIQNTNLPNKDNKDDYLLSFEADIKDESRKLINHFDSGTFENFINFFTESFEEIGFYVFTKKIIKSFKFIFAFCEKNFKKEISQFEPNVNYHYKCFLSIAYENRYFAFVLEKEFSLYSSDLIAVKIIDLESKRKEKNLYMFKQKRRMKNQKRREKIQRNNNFIKIGEEEFSVGNIHRNGGSCISKYSYPSNNFITKFFDENFEK